MAETNEFFIKIGADVDDAMTKLNALSSRLSSFASNTQRSGNQISGSMTDTSKVISAAFSSIGLALTTVGIVGGILSIGKAALTTAAELEQISVSFKVFTGSAETAKNMLAQLKEQALNSPMQFQDIAKGAQTLLGYGLTAEQVIPLTRMLGDISGGNADKFSRLSLAFGQVNAAGRLMGQEARQMINAGFNPLQAISDKTGESMATLTQKMHDGQISVRDVGEAFIFATSEGGRYFGMADEQAKTLQGTFNKLSESVTFALADVGESLKTTFDLSGVVLILTNSIDILKDSFKAFNLEGKQSSVWADILKGAVVGLTIALDLLIRTFKLLKLGAESIISTWGNRLGQVIKGTSEQIYKGLQFSPLAGVANGINDYFKNIINKATDANTNVKKSKTELEKLREEYDKLLKTLSGKPSKTGKDPKKAEKVEVISGTDFVTKSQGERIKALIQMEKDAGIEIRQLGLSADQKKLADLKLSHSKLMIEMNKAGVDSTAISFKLLSEISLLAQKIESEKNSAIMKLIKPIDLKGQGFNLKTLESDMGFDEARISAQTENMKRFGAEMYAAQTQVATQLASGFAQIAGSIISGDMGLQDAFASLGALFLNAIGGFLVQVGEAAVKAAIVKLVIEDALKGLAGGPLLAIGLTAIAIGTAMQNMGQKTQQAMQAKKGASASVSSSSASSGMKSGSVYQNGSQTYGGQMVRLFIDLTGSITQTQSGYQIQKSMETNLRITGR